MGHMVDLFLDFFEDSPYWFPEWMGQFAITLTVNEGSLFLVSYPEIVAGCFVDLCYFG